MMLRRQQAKNTFSNGLSTPQNKIEASPDGSSDQAKAAHHRGQSSDSFWKGVHSHHQSNYVVNHGVMAHITEITRDAANMKKLADINKMKKDQAKFLLNGNKCPLINPVHKYKHRWDVFIALIIIYSAIVIPYSIGFGVEFQDDSLIGVLNIIFDLCFGFDLILSFNLAYEDDLDGAIIQDRIKIAHRYFYSWFWIDFFSTVPIDRIAFAIMGSSSNGTRSLKLIRTLRLFRLAKLVRLFKLKRVTAIIRQLEINPGVLSLGNLMVKIFFVAHLLGCFWGLCHLNGEDGSNTWAVNFGSAEHDDVSGQYVDALYWTVATMMGVGYGDVHAVNSMERGYSIFAQAVGAFTFGWILATMTIFYESSDPRTAKIDGFIEELKSYMNERKLPKKLQVAVLSNYHYRNQTRSVFAEEQILSELSTHLSEEVIKNGYRKTINSFPIFLRCSSQFACAICAHLRPLFVEENDTLYEQDRMALGVYFLRDGMVIASQIPKGRPTRTDEMDPTPLQEQTSENLSRLIATYQNGTHFGHETFLLKKESLAHVRAASNSDVLMAPLDALEDLVLDNPTLFDDLEIDAKELFSKIETVIAQYDNLEEHSAAHREENLKVVLNGKLCSYKKRKRTLSFARAQSSKLVDEGSDDDDDYGAQKIKSVSVQETASRKRQQTFPCLFPPSKRVALPMTDVLSKLQAESELDSQEWGTDVSDDEDQKKDDKEDNLDEETDISARIKRKSSMKEVFQQEMEEARQQMERDPKKNMVSVNLTIPEILKLGFVHPSQKYKQRFDLLVGFLIIYSVVLIPFMLAFDVESEGLVLIADWIVDIIFAADIVVTSKTPYLDLEKRAFVCDNKMIMKRYLFTWFAVDFFSTIPIDKVAVAAVEGSQGGGEDNLKLFKLVKGLRLIRLLKLARVFKLGKIQDSLEEAFDSPNTLKLIKLGLMLVTIAHWIGCIWFAQSPRSTPPQKAWWGAVPDLAENPSTGDLYVASLYWAFTTMTTVGYGDILPVTSDEKLTAIIMMVVGATVFGYVIGNVAATTMSHDIAQARKQDKMIEVTSYLKEKNISRSLKKKVEGFFLFMFEHRSSFDEHELLHDLPRSTKNHVFLHLYGDVANKFAHSMFRNVKKTDACHILSYMRTNVYASGDIVFKEGDVGDALYLIQVGIIEELRLDAADIAARVYHEGSYFGEKALMLKIDRLNTTRAKTMAVLLALNKDTIARLVDKSSRISAALKTMLVQTINLTISEEQQKRAKESNAFAGKVTSKVYALLLSKAKRARESDSLHTAGASSFTDSKRHSIISKLAMDERKDRVDSIFDSIHEEVGKSYDYGTDMSAGEADAGGGGIPR